MIREFINRLLALGRGKQVSHELDEELRFHVHKQTEANLARGMAPEEARRQALLALGGIDKTREEYRDALGFRLLEDLIRDLRYGLRQLRRSPGFSLTAVACLALGVGASTAIYSVVSAVLLKPLPFRDSARLVRVYTEFPERPGGGLSRFAVSPPEFLELRREGRAWDQIEAWTTLSANVSSTSEPVRIMVPYVTGGLMSMMGVAPQLGRMITPEDASEGAPFTLVLSHGLWQQAFGSDPSIIGRDVYFNDSKATIIGVMPAGFEFPPGLTEPAGAWAPLQLTAADQKKRTNHMLSVIARLRSGLRREAARSELAGLMEQFRGRDTAGFHSLDPKRHPAAIYGLRDDVVGDVRLAMLMLLGAVAFFLLIACVNVANLLLARSSARRREVALRRAMGASTPQLFRQFTVEGILLSFAGAAAGVPLAAAAVRLITATNAGMIPRIREAGIDGSVLGFSLAVTVLTGLVFGLAPLLHSGTRSLSLALQAATGRAFGSKSTNRLRAVLVAGELSLALTLLIGAGLLARSLWNLQRVKLGFDHRGLITMRVSVKGEAYADEARLRRLWSELSERLSALPGVQSATVADGLPPQRFAVHNDTQIENFVRRPGGPLENVDFYQSVGRRFFETLGIRLMEGRFFDARDGFGAPPVVIVNETMARTFWPGASPLGRRIRQPGGEWMTVAGVVADVRNAGLDRPAGTEIFLPADQLHNVTPRTYVILKTAGHPDQVLNAARQVIREMDPSLPVALIRTMDDVLGEAQSRPRFLSVMLTLFSALALVLAAFGIYGVVAYSVAQRTAEFGIRMALGARQSDVLALVLGQGVRLTMAGLAIGLAGAFAATRVLSGLLYGVSPADAPTFALVTSLLAAVALLASYIPARRASKVDPMVALRYE
jgi:putative ABC transport system permease protein